MADYFTNDEELTAVADAIREKTGGTDPLRYEDGFVGAIRGIQTATEAINDNVIGTSTTWSSQKINTELGTKIPSSQKGAANGVATLDAQGKIPAAQLPSVADDDVFEYASRSNFPEAGVAAKIYVAKDTGFLYTWNGTTYVTLVDDSLAATNKVWSASKVSGELTDLEETVTESMDDLEETLNAEISRLDGVKAESDNLYAYKTAGPDSVVEVYDAVAEAVKQMQIEIAPVQDLHGYDKPWVGGAGKNKLPLPVATTQDGITLVRNDDGSVTLTGTAERTTYFDCFAGTFDSTAFAGYKMIVYATSGAISSSNLRIRISDSTRVSIQELTNAETEATIADNGSGLYLAIRVPNGLAIPSGGYTLKPMLYAPNESSTFAPYSNICPISGFTGCEVTVANGDDPTAQGYDSETYTITFPSSVGTVYGGNLTVNEDGSGKLVVDRYAHAYDGSETWQPSIMKDYFSLWNQPPSVSNTDIKQKANWAVAGANKYQRFGAYRAQTNGAVVVGNLINEESVNYKFADVIEFKAYLATTPLFVCYELATPVTYQLTIPQIRTLLGYNRIYASTGSILSMLYPAEKYQTAEQADRERIHAVVDEPSAAVSVTDGADNVPMGMQIAIEPVQDLHGYENPWPAGRGKNLCPDTWNTGKYLTNSGRLSDAPDTMTSELIKVKPSTKYTYSGENLHVHGDATQNYIQIAFYTEEDQSIGQRITNDNSSLNVYTFTTYETTAYIRVSASLDSTNIQVEEGQTATTYAPYSNICPITGWTGAEITHTGKNLFDGIFTTGRLISDTGAEGSNADHKISTNYIPVKASSNYTISGTDIHKRPTSSSSTTNTFVNVARYRADKSFIDRAFSSQTSDLSYTFETTNETAFVRFTVGIEGYDVQVEYGQEASGYTPFVSADTYSITFPSGQTVYGGTLTVNKDGTGTLTKEWVTTTLENKTFGTWQSSTLPAGGFIPVSGFDPSFDTQYAPISDILKGTTYADRGAEGSIAPNVSKTTLYIFTALNTAELVKEKYGNATICYRLETPITYTLSAPVIRSLLGTNNVWANTGNVLRLDYTPDTKSYIDNLFASLTNATGQTF